MNFQKRTWEQQESSNDLIENSLVKVGTADLIGRFKSKTDIFSYLTEILGYHMPPIECVNRDYLRQILKGEKKLIKLNEIRMVHVPKYDELSVKSIYKSIKEDNEVINYLPDMTENQKPIERNFFFNVLNTLQPEYVQHIIKQTQEKRNNPTNEEAKKDYILISDDWLNQLTSHPFVSKKKGRTLQLLKSSAKIFKARKPKQPPQNVISLKRFKGIENGFNSAIKPQAEVNIINPIENPFRDINIDSSNINGTKMRFNI